MSSEVTRGTMGSCLGQSPKRPKFKVTAGVITYTSDLKLRVFRLGLPLLQLSSPCPCQRGVSVKNSGSATAGETVPAQPICDGRCRDKRMTSWTGLTPLPRLPKHPASAKVLEGET